MSFRSRNPVASGAPPQAPGTRRFFTAIRDRRLWCWFPTWDRLNDRKTIQEKSEWGLLQSRQPDLPGSGQKLFVPIADKKMTKIRILESWQGIAYPALEKCHCSSTAEQRFCKPQVGSSNLPGGFLARLRISSHSGVFPPHYQ